MYNDDDERNNHVDIYRASLFVLLFNYVRTTECKVFFLLVFCLFWIQQIIAVVVKQYVGDPVKNIHYQTISILTLELNIFLNESNYVYIRLLLLHPIQISDVRGNPTTGFRASTHSCKSHSTIKLYLPSSRLIT